MRNRESKIVQFSKGYRSNEQYNNLYHIRPRPNIFKFIIIIKRWILTCMIFLNCLGQNKQLKKKNPKSNNSPIDTEYYTISHNLLPYYKHLVKSFLHRMYCAGLQKIQFHIYILYIWVGPEFALCRYAINESALLIYVVIIVGHRLDW